MAKHNNSSVIIKKMKFYQKPSFISKLNTALLITILGFCIKIYLKM